MTTGQYLPNRELLEKLYFHHSGLEMEVPKARMAYTKIFTAFNVTILLALLAAFVSWDSSILAIRNEAELLEIQENAKFVLLTVGTFTNYIWLRISRSYGRVIRGRYARLMFLERRLVPNADGFGIYVQEARDLFGVEVDRRGEFFRRDPFFFFFDLNYYGLSRFDVMLPLTFFLAYLITLLLAGGIYTFSGFIAFVVMTAAVTIPTR